MKITRLEAENFKKLTAIDITFGEHVTEISGPNGSGKSSTLDGIYLSLVGLDSKTKPKEPIRRGADSCFIRSHYGHDEEGGIIITRRFRKLDDGETVSDISIETPEGARYPSPQTHLNKIISDHLLDPLQFIGMKDEEQFDILRSFVPDFDFSANERLRAGAFAKRTDIGRDQRREQAAADAIEIADKAPGERVDEAALTAELEAAGRKNLETQQRRTNRERAAQRIADLLADAKDRQMRCDETVADLERQIAELQARIENEKSGAALEIETAHKEAEELQAKLDSAEPLPDEVDAAAITAKLNEARRTNRAIEDWEAQRARKLQHQREADRLSAEYDGLTEKITECDQAKQDAIRKATLPVAGLGFGDGYITLNEIPFRQASTAEKLRTAFAISVAKRPKLRLCWIRDASLLDDNSLAIVEQLAREFDCQVLLETVRANSTNAIVLEDGHVKGVEPKPKNEPQFELSADAPAAATTGRKKRPPSKPWTGPGAPKGDAA